MMRSDFSKFSGGGNSPTSVIVSRNQKRNNSHNSSQTAHNIGEDNNKFNYSQKLRSQADIIKNASLKSQIVFGVGNARGVGVDYIKKKDDGSYNTSYSMLYKWKNPISFNG